MSEKQYIDRCFSCSSTKEHGEGENGAVGRDKAMTRETPPQCTSASNPEMAGNAYSDEPCDDGSSRH